MEVLQGKALHCFTKGKKKYLCLHSETNLLLSNRGRAVHILCSRSAMFATSLCTLVCACVCFQQSSAGFPLQCVYAVPQEAWTKWKFIYWVAFLKLLQAIIMSMVFAVQQKNSVLGSQPSIASAPKKKARGLTYWSLTQATHKQSAYSNNRAL